MPRISTALYGALLLATLMPIAAAAADQSPPSTETAAQPASSACANLQDLTAQPQGATDSACSVPKGNILIESSYENATYSGAGGAVVSSYPSALIRVGTDVRGLELDVAPPSERRVSSGGQITTGTTDLAAGLRYQALTSSQGAVGVSFTASAPTGTSGIDGGDGYAYKAGINLVRKLGDFGLGGTFAYGSFFGPQEIESLSAVPQPGVFPAVGSGFFPGTVAANEPSLEAAAAASETRYHTFLPSLALSAGFPAGVSGFVGIAGATNAGPGFGPQYAMEYGLSKTVADRFVVGVDAGNTLGASNGGRAHDLGATLGFYVF